MKKRVVSENGVRLLYLRFERESEGVYIWYISKIFWDGGVDGCRDAK